MIVISASFSIEIQLAYFSVPDEVMINIARFFPFFIMMVFLVREILRVQMTVLYPIIVFLIFDGVIKIILAEYELVI